MVEPEHFESRDRDVETSGFARSFAAATRSLGRGQDPTIRTDHPDGSTAVRRVLVVCAVAGLTIAGTIGIGAIVALERGHHGTTQNAASIASLAASSPAAPSPSPTPSHTPAKTTQAAATTPARVVTTIVVTKTSATKAKTTSAPSVKSTDTPPAGYGSTNLAIDHPVTVTNYTQNYVGSNITDGNVDTYWEGDSNDYPETVTIDLGSVRWVARIVLSLPQASDWNTRTETIEIRGSQTSSTDPTQTLVGTGNYTFNANSSAQDGTAVTFTPVKTRYLILTFTANSGWGAAQLSELAAYS